MHRKCVVPKLIGDLILGQLFARAAEFARAVTTAHYQLRASQQGSDFHAEKWLTPLQLLFPIARNPPFAKKKLHQLGSYGSLSDFQVLDK